MAGMTRVRLILVAVLLAACQLARAGCEAPRPPSKVPNGNEATEAEMIAAMQTLKRYNVDVGNFAKCLEFEAQQNRLPRYEQALRHNAAIDALESIATKFNEQLRVFKARSNVTVAAK
jgi:hypothetical protein